MTWRRPLKPKAEPLWKLTVVLGMLDMKTVGNNFNNLHSKTWHFAHSGTLAIETSKPVATLSLDSWVGWSWKQSRNFPIAPPKMRNHLESCTINLNHFNFEWTCYSFGGADRFRSSLGLRAATQGCTVVPRVFRAYTNWYLSSPTCHSVPSWHWILILPFMALDLDTSSAFHRNFLRCLAGAEPGCRDGSRFSLVLCPERFQFWSSTRRHDVLLTQSNSVKAFACAGAASASVWCIRSAFGAPGVTWMQMAVAFWSAWSRIYRWVSISALPRNTSKLDLIVRIAEHTPSTQWRRIWDVHCDSSATVSELQAFFLFSLEGMWGSHSHLLKAWRPSLKVLGWGSFTDRLRRRCRTSVLQRGHWQGYVSDSLRHGVTDVCVYWSLCLVFTCDFQGFWVIHANS